MTASARTDEQPHEDFVDPDVMVLLSAADPSAPDVCEMSTAVAREAVTALAATALAAVDVAEFREVNIPTACGSIRGRLYRPHSESSGPLMVFFHGGGWVVGSLDQVDRALRRLANDSGVSILSVDYRLAPEHPYPAALDDCMAALQWATSANLGFERTVLVVGGDSAGGNLAAATAQLVRDRGGPKIDHQMLIYPVVCRRFDTPSYQRFAKGYFLTTATMQWFWQHYVGDAAAPPYADLYAAGELTGLPPATVITCGLDVLSDEGDRYAADLAAAGIAVTHMRVAGLIHGIWFMDASGLRAYQFGLDVAGALRRAVSIAPQA